MALNHPTVTSDRGMKNDENPITTNASGNTPWTDSDEPVRSASAAQRPERRRQDEPQVGVRGEPRHLVADPAPAEITAMKNSGNAGAGTMAPGCRRSAPPTAEPGPTAACLCR